MRPFLFTIFLALVSHAVTAQSTTTAFSVNGGYVDGGFGVDVAYNRYLTQEAKLHIGVFFSRFIQDFKAEQINNSVITLNWSYHQMIWASYRKSVRLSLGIGVVAGYEDINNGDDRLPSGAIINGESKFIYGLSAGSEVDIILTDQLSLLVQFVEYYHINSDVGNFLPYAGVGLRYFLF